MAIGCQLLQQDGDDIGRKFLEAAEHGGYCWRPLPTRSRLCVLNQLTHQQEFKDGTSVGFRKPINIALLRVRVEKFKFSGPAGDLSVRLTYRGTADQLTMMNAGQNNSYSAESFAKMTFGTFGGNLWWARPLNYYYFFMTDGEDGIQIFYRHLAAREREGPQSGITRRELSLKWELDSTKCENYKEHVKIAQPVDNDRSNTMEDLERHGQPHHTDDNGTTYIMQISGDVSGFGDGL
ncbi:hypothetical protein Bbelb_435390 [Branchiostoma belcheri]|nr:hypothetical protein Bbelb_435390 [Branchiostoma belcheri]